MGKGKGKDNLRTVSQLGGEAIYKGSLCSPQRLEGNAQQLLPGLQNDIVLDHIVPKLPWRAFHILSSVSPYWRDAIQSRQVHDARARFNSLEALVIMNHNDPDGNIHVISLYSLRENTWHQLPDFPFYKKGIPYSSDCVVLQGSLYVLGGEPENGHVEDSEDSVPELYDSDGRPVVHDSDGRPVVPNTGKEVFVLNLVEQRGWKRCADLPRPSLEFACGVLNEKIYVLGGYNKDKCTNECLVYDPKEDRWSSIAPMTSKRNDHHVVAVGDELWVHGGWCDYEHEVVYSEVYYPAKDEWNSVRPAHTHESERLLTAKGKLYLITPHHIYRREESSKRKGWIKGKDIFSDDYPPDAYDELVVRDDLFDIVGAEAVDKELLVLIVVQYYDDDDETTVILYRSDGFGTEQEYVEFYEVKGWIDMDHRWYPRVMCPIDL